MFNKTGALMLQTIMVLMDRQNTTVDMSQYTSSAAERLEVERCYEPYGCFSVAYPWVTESRPVNNFPVSPDQLGVRFAVFTRRNLKFPLVLSAESRQEVRGSNIDPAGPFYLISHGYMESGDKPWIESMTRALLSQAEHPSASVLVVDWRLGSSPPYTQAVANIRLVGVITAHLVKLLYDELELPNLDNFHYIGHSLGAHLGGYCGHALQRKFKLKLGRITGLDPAEPHFANTVSLVRLDRTDAQFVDVIHTDATPLYSGGFGISEHIGHVDFFPNGGNDQPGCDEGMMTSIQSEKGSIWRGMRRLISCNHVRSYQFFTESVAPKCPFYAVHCSSYDAFLAGNCSRCDRQHVCMPFGLHSYPVYQRLLSSGLVNKSSSVAMYLLTGDGAHGKPFCKVHYKVTFKVSESAKSFSEGEVGQLRVKFVDVNGRSSDYVPLDSKGGAYHPPGTVSTVLAAATGTGAPPASAVLDWHYETSLLNPLTWRLLSSPRIHIDWLAITSLEYTAEFKVCPEPNQPIVANVPHHLNSSNCVSAVAA